MHLRRIMAGATCALGALAGPGLAMAQVHVMTGTFNPGDDATVVINATWSDKLYGQFYFDGGPDLIGASISSESALRVQPGRHQHAIVIVPLSGGCSAELGTTCAIGSGFGVGTLGLVAPQSVAFNTPLRTALTPDFVVQGRTKRIGPDVASTFTFDFGDFEGPIDYRVEYSINTVIPEPSTWALLILGFGAVGATFRSRLVHA